MIKYDGYYIAFQEVPDEISLIFTISNCKHNCVNCHSPWLKDDIGLNLEKDFNQIVSKYDEMITCVCFMGEGNDVKSLLSLIKKCKYKVAIYTGLDVLSDWMMNFDYIKIGHYEDRFGGLDSPNTNQRFFKNENGELTDLTYRFIKHKI